MVEYQSNNLFYNSSYCNVSPLPDYCTKNKTQSDALELQKMKTKIAKEKYKDSLDLYNRELLYTFNMSLGVGALMVYVYYNQTSLPFFRK